MLVKVMAVAISVGEVTDFTIKVGNNLFLHMKKREAIMSREPSKAGRSFQGICSLCQLCKLWRRRLFNNNPRYPILCFDLFFHLSNNNLFFGRKAA